MHLELKQNVSENNRFESGNLWIKPHVGLYSETTWAVGIAQLTHHEVQGGGKNPETGGRGIFAPTADRVVS